MNGLGEASLLGEALVSPVAPLMAWPVPYRGGELEVRFAVASGRGGGLGSAIMVLYDARGCRVRTIARGEYPDGMESARWDGLDEQGQNVLSGLYFLRAQSGGEESQLKIVVLQ